jgi:hypothetical protein
MCWLSSEYRVVKVTTASLYEAGLKATAHDPLRNLARLALSPSNI